MTLLLAAVVVISAAGCGTQSESGSADSSVRSPATGLSLFPPTVNEGTFVSGPVSRLRPGVPIMVGREATQVCMAGFYLDYPDPHQPGHRIPGFLTAAQCARGDDHAPVAVTEDAGAQQRRRSQIGAISYLTAGATEPTVAGRPWTMATSPLAVFSSGQPRWALPVDVAVNNATPTTEVLQTARPAEQRNAPALWTNNFGAIVTGHVLDPASTPELADIPANVERVVVAADDTASPLYPQLLGSPVTVEMDTVTHNLGVIVGVDDERRWVVVDLIGPFLAAQGASLITTN